MMIAAASLIKLFFIVEDYEILYQRPSYGHSIGTCKPSLPAHLGRCFGVADICRALPLDVFDAGQEGILVLAARCA